MRRLDTYRYDYFLLVVVILLVCIGLVMVYSASHHIAMKKHNEDGAYYFKKHFIRVIIGLVLMVLGALIPYRFWLRLSKPMILVGIALLVAVLLHGVTIRNATRWYKLGGFLFQPVDFVRLALIFYLTDAIVRKRDYLEDFKIGVLPQLVVVGTIAILLLKQPDMGSAVILVAISLVLLISGGMPLRHVGWLSLGVLPLGLLVRSYHLERLRDYIQSIRGVEIPYQVKQALISLGNGGIFGVGLDNSIQKLEYLPDPFTDFILAIVGEEFGFVGSVVVLTLFLLLVVEGYRIARRCDDMGGFLLAVGITTSLALYAFVNAGVVCNLLPTKGLPLPFISYGGSFMMSNLFAIGVLLNISQHPNSK
jgi:cell division protein FtsW